MSKITADFHVFIKSFDKSISFSASERVSQLQFKLNLQIANAYKILGDRIRDYLFAYRSSDSADLSSELRYFVDSIGNKYTSHNFFTSDYIFCITIVAIEDFHIPTKHKAIAYNEGFNANCRYLNPYILFSSELAKEWDNGFNYKEQVQMQSTKAPFWIKLSGSITQPITWDSNNGCINVKCQSPELVLPAFSLSLSTAYADLAEKLKLTFNIGDKAFENLLDSLSKHKYIKNSLTLSDGMSYSITIELASSFKFDNETLSNAFKEGEFASKSGSKDNPYTHLDMLMADMWLAGYNSESPEVKQCAKEHAPTDDTMKLMANLYEILKHIMVMQVKFKDTDLSIDLNKLPFPVKTHEEIGKLIRHLKTDEGFEASPRGTNYIVIKLK